MKRTAHLLFSALLMFAASLFAAKPASAADDFLDPEVAFKTAARVLDGRSIELSFDVAPGYYLYREQFKFAATGATLGKPLIPAGKVKFDETFQKKVETHRDQVRIVVPVKQAGGSFRLAVNYQGCADKGLCYPPQQMRADVSLAAFGGTGNVTVLPGREMPIAGAEAADAPARSAHSAIERVLQSGALWQIVAAFFVAGLGLAFTPCVLPMVPILSSIIVGKSGDASARRGRSFALSLSYSAGVTTIYTGLGIAAGLAGGGLAAYLQNAWVLALFALTLVVLSLSMFGVYELQMPAALTGPLTHTCQRLPAGRFAGVFAMGGVSALIVSPCVAAPLAAGLVFISQRGDVALGAAALFALAIGMCVPLLLVGASAGALLPKAGAWMDLVKRIFGVVLLAVAVWIVQPVLPEQLILALWGALLITIAAVLIVGVPGLGRAGWARVAFAAVFGLFGALQVVGAATGGVDPLKPLGHFRQAGEVQIPVAFRFVRSVAELDASMDAARSSGQPLMLDFYADWCVSCKEMERFTYSDPAVRAKLAKAVLLKADVTKNNAEDRELLKRFGLFGPPGTIFFDTQGHEVADARVIGYQSSDRFLQTLAQAGL